MPVMYDVHYLEHFADRFVELGLYACGITLEQYLAAPDRYEQRTQHHRSLLPAQRAVRERLEATAALEPVEAEVDELPRRNGAPFEPLHHKRHLRSMAAYFDRRARS